MPQGYLLFSAMVENRIYKYDPKEGVSVFMEKSGLTYTVPANSIVVLELSTR